MRRLEITSFGPAPVDEPRCYPGRVPGGSFLYDGDALWRREGSEPSEALREELERRGGVPATERWAVVCAGSNACPTQIERKLGPLPGPQLVLFEKLALRGLRAVYAGHVARYGVVPATLERGTGAVSLFVALYTVEQLRAVHATEHGNYTFAELPDVGAVTAGRDDVAPLYGFLSKRGVLVLDGAPVELTSRDQSTLLETLLAAAARLSDAPSPASYLEAPGRHRQALEDAIGKLGLRRPTRLVHRSVEVSRYH